MDTQKCVNRPVLLLIVALMLAGIDLPEPATGVVVDLDREGGRLVKLIRSGCKSWQLMVDPDPECAAVLVDRQPSRYFVDYRWEHIWSGVTRCEVDPDEYFNVKMGDVFRCEA